MYTFTEISTDAKKSAEYEIPTKLIETIKQRLVVVQFFVNFNIYIPRIIFK